MSTSSPYDVIVAGAGPVGLFLSCELALAGCSVLILERADNPASPLKKLPFGIRGLSAPTVEALYRRGLLDQLEVPKRLKDPHANGGQGALRQAGHFAGIPFHEGNVDTSQWGRLPSSTPNILISEMAELESVLADRPKALGVKIIRGLAVTGCSQTPDGVIVQAGDESFAGKWLVGCDGARSVVRKTAGFAFPGTEPQFTGYSAHVEMADPQKLKPGRNVTETGMYLQSQPGFLVLQDFDGGAFHYSQKAITMEHVQEVLRRVSQTNATISTMHIATTWTDRARQAGAYRNGRILLAGDAAHIHSPLGGQGLNLGIGDAMNLGWKLAATIQNRAPENLLDTYQVERHPLGAQVLEWSRAQVALMKPDPAARALHAIFRDLMNTRDGATYIAARVWGIFTHYDLDGSHPLTGHSIPNFELEDEKTTGECMRNGHGILLDFRENPSLKALTSNYSSLDYIQGPAKQNSDLSAALVRPDGVVAWATDSKPELPEVEAAARRWFGH